MDKKSREPRTLFEVLKEINIKLDEHDKSLKEIRELLRKISPV